MELKHLIQEKVEKIPIEVVIGKFLKLEKRGRHYVSKCPFHEDDKDNSLKVNPAAQRYMCFSCGVKGSGVQFVMAYKKMPHAETILTMMQMFNIKLDTPT